MTSKQETVNVVSFRKLRQAVAPILEWDRDADPQEIVKRLGLPRKTEHNGNTISTVRAIKAIAQGKNPFEELEIADAKAKVDEKAAARYVDLLKQIKSLQAQIEEVRGSLNVPTGFKLIPNLETGDWELKKLRRGGGGTRHKYTAEDFPRSATFKGHAIEFAWDNGKIAVTVDNTAIGSFPTVTDAANAALQYAGASPGTRRNFRTWAKPSS